MARAMVGAALHKVNKSRVQGQGPRAGEAGLYLPHPRLLAPFFVLRNPPHQADWPPVSADHCIVLYLVFVVLASVALMGLIWLREERMRRHENAIRVLLDGADALESQLQECRQRMQTLREMLVILPEEMSEQANTALSADDKVEAALKDLLAHRLWIKQNSANATLQQLDAARTALTQSGATLQAQLDRLAAIAADLQRAQANAQSITPPSA